MLDPWPHSEAGRFHRGLSLVQVAIAALILIAERVRHHSLAEVLVLLGVALVTTVVGNRLLRDFRAHPSEFPAPSPAQGVRLGTRS